MQHIYIYVIVLTFQKFSGLLQAKTTRKSPGPALGQINPHDMT